MELPKMEAPIRPKLIEAHQRTAWPQAERGRQVSRFRIRRLQVLEQLLEMLHSQRWQGLLVSSDRREMNLSCIEAQGGAQIVWLFCGNLSLPKEPYRGRRAMRMSLLPQIRTPFPHVNTSKNGLS